MSDDAGPVSPDPEPPDNEETALERAETLRLPAPRWLALWGVPALAVIVLFAVLIQLTR